MKSSETQDKIQVMKTSDLKKLPNTQLYEIIYRYNRQTATLK